MKSETNSVFHKRILQSLLVLFFLILPTEISAQCSILSNGSVVSISKMSWGQTFVPSCNTSIDYIIFNAASAVNTPCTFTLRNGTDCGTTVLYTHKIDNISVGGNRIDLATVVNVTAGNTYYFSVETDDNSTWQIFYSNTSQVAGNLKSHQPSSAKSACDLNWSAYDWAFSVNTEPACNIISKGDVISSINSLSWGQSFIAPCTKSISYILFNAASAVNSVFNLVIRDGADCNANVIHSQQFNGISDGFNNVKLSAPVGVVANKTYYFSIENDGTSTWKIRYNSTSQVPGNMKTHQTASQKTACDNNFSGFDMAFCIDTIPFNGILSKGRIISSLNQQSWGQSFVPMKSTAIKYIVFNAASDINSSFTLKIRNGADCNSTILHTQTIEKIVDGDNKITLTSPVNLIADNTYYFSVESDNSTTWKIRYNSVSQVAGNLKSHLAGSDKTACDRNFPTFDWAFSVDTIIPELPFPELGQKVDLFVLGGQSNAQGWRGDAAQYPIDTLLLDRYVGLSYTYVDNTSSNGRWIQMQPQEGLFMSGHFGPEVSFGRRLKAYGLNPAIFKYTCGGTSINSFWKTPGAGGKYDALVSDLKTDIATLEKLGYTVNIRGFIWIQGEADAANATIANEYYAKLLSIVTDFRQNVAKNNNLPIILGVDEQYPSVITYPIIWQSQQRIASEIGNALFTSMYGLPKADNTHLTPAGLYTHGIRLFDAYKTITSGTTNTTIPSLPDPEFIVLNRTLKIALLNNIFDVQLTDGAGKLLIKKINANGIVEIDNLSKGIYIVSLKSQNRLITRKIVI